LQYDVSFGHNAQRHRRTDGHYHANSRSYWVQYDWQKIMVTVYSPMKADNTVKQLNKQNEQKTDKLNYKCCEVISNRKS